MEDPVIHVVPTELERKRLFPELVSFLVGLWLTYEMIQRDLGWWALPFDIVIGLWVLSGEAAADDNYVGALAAGLRSKLGQRRLHEWLVAAAHFWRVAILPVWRRACEALWRSIQRATIALLRRANAAMRCSLLRVSLWVSIIRFSLSAGLAKSRRGLIGLARRDWRGLGSR